MTGNRIIKIFSVLLLFAMLIPLAGCRLTPGGSTGTEETAGGDTVPQTSGETTELTEEEIKSQIISFLYAEEKTPSLSCAGIEEFLFSNFSLSNVNAPEGKQAPFTFIGSRDNFEYMLNTGNDGYERYCMIIGNMFYEVTRNKENRLDVTRAVKVEQGTVLDLSLFSSLEIDVSHLTQSFYRGAPYDEEFPLIPQITADMIEVDDAGAVFTLPQEYLIYVAQCEAISEDMNSEQTKEYMDSFSGKMVYKKNSNRFVMTQEAVYPEIGKVTISTTITLKPDGLSNADIDSIKTESEYAIDYEGKGSSDIKVKFEISDFEFDDGRVTECSSSFQMEGSAYTNDGSRKDFIRRVVTRLSPSQSVPGDSDVTVTSSWNDPYFGNSRCLEIISKGGGKYELKCSRPSVSGYKLIYEGELTLDGESVPPMKNDVLAAIARYVVTGKQ